MIKVGLTGGIGSGKSVVARLFQIMGFPVYVADTESKRLTESSPVIRQELTDLFGEEVYQNNKLNRALLAGCIFSDKSLLAKVNSIIHPVVLADFVEWAVRQQTEIVVIESAILFESGFDKKVDSTLMVYAPETLRLQRVQERDGFPVEEIRKRMNNQLPDEEKCKLSGYIIRNTNHEPLIPQVEAFVNYLLHGK
ncbi:MAG: dephospho-CoA kinase [Tannerellaceae bacterium]|nr:dephospho-CoA kinase [Tannerellaceae bacterium]